MFTHPDRIGQLASENHRQMLAQASRRRLLHQEDGPTARTAGLAARMTRRLATAIARAGVVTAQAPGAVWPVGPHPLGEPVGQAQTPGRSQ
jgi:hypothetical protein